MSICNMSGSVALIFCLFVVVLSHSSATQLPLRSFNASAAPYSLCFQSDGTLVVRLDLNDGIVRYDVSGTGIPILISTFRTGDDSGSNIVTDDDGSIYSPLYDRSSVIKLNRNGTAIVGVFTGIDFAPFTIAIGPEEVYVGSPVFNNITILSKASMSVITTVPLPVPDQKYAALDLVIDSTKTQLFFALPGGILRCTTRGVRTGFWSIPGQQSEAIALAIDQLDNLYYLDDSNLVAPLVYKLNPQGIITFIFTLSAPYPGFGTVPRIAINPMTGNIWITEITGYTTGIIREYSSIAAQCTTGPTAGLIDLNQISPSGADIQGINNARTYEFVWNVCGNVSEDLCQKYAPGSSLCALNLPTTTGVIVARPPPTAISWSILPPSNATEPASLRGVVMNGDECGQYHLQSLLIIILKCAQTQDKTFVVDDSGVSPTASVCSYVLIFNTPIVCGILNHSLVQTY